MAMRSGFGRRARNTAPVPLELQITGWQRVPLEAARPFEVPRTVMRHDVQTPLWPTQGT